MVDIHSHILPDTDDGASSWEVALEMCRVAEQDGTTHIVATPHANDEFAFNRPELEARLELLRERYSGKLQFSLGCDFHFSVDNLEAAMLEPARFTINRSRFLLVELSDYALPPHTWEALKALIDKKVVPIITHPERNMVCLRNPQLVVRFKESGCLVQVTASAFTGRWGQGSKKFAEAMLKSNLIDVVASDAHGVKDRPPVLSEARRVITGLADEVTAESLFEAVPGGIASAPALE